MMFPTVDPTKTTHHKIGFIAIKRVTITLWTLKCPKVAIFKLDFLYLLLLYYAQELQFADFNRYLDVFYTPEG